MNIRPARVGDVPSIQELIRTFADRKLMIRRSPGELYESIREFFVAVDDDGRIIGCAALHVFWCIPYTELLLRHTRVQPFRKVLIQMTVADEARIELDRLQ